MTRKIIHIDMDAFFASVEQRDNPELRGKPIAVGGSAERGVVAAASYEARIFGVRSAMPSVTAKRLCKDLIFVKSRFDAYKAVSQQIRQIFAEFTPLIEPLSLDEAYLDVTNYLPPGQTAYATAKAIRRRIFEVTGLTASAGVSYNKFFAKLASDYRKPNGQFAVLPEQGEIFIEQLAVGKFHGIGPATEKRMKDRGIHTGLDLKNKTLDYLLSEFGKAGTWYYNIARGIDHREVKSNRIRKSYGSEKTFSEDLTSEAEISEKLAELVEKMWKWYYSTPHQGTTLTLKAKYNDFNRITRSRTISGGFSSQEHLTDVAEQLARTLLPLLKPVRLLGLSVSNFRAQEIVYQGELF